MGRPLYIKPYVPLALFLLLHPEKTTFITIQRLVANMNLQPNRRSSPSEIQRISRIWKTFVIHEGQFGDSSAL